MPKQNAPRIHFVDRPDLSETFADAIHGLTFDGQSMRIEFCTTRLDPPRPPQPLSARRYPVCRLVLTPNAGIELFNQLQKIIKALEKNGVVHKTPQTPITPATVQ